MKQAGQSVERKVWAYAGDGRKVLTPESETVSIPVCPVKIDMDNGTPWTPKLARFLFCEGIDQLPHKLIRIEPPGTLRPKTVLETQNDGTRAYKLKQVPINYWRVTFAFKRPNPRMLGKKTKISSVCVFDERDARDPYFQELSESDRHQILSAVLPATTSTERGKVQS